MAAIIAFFAVSHSRKLMKQLEAFGLRFVPAALRPKVAELADSFIDGLQVLRSWRDLIMVVLTSLVAWCCDAGMYWMVSLAFRSLNLSAAAVFMTLAVANLATLVPSTPGSVGPFDAAASYVILLHAALYLPVTLVGLVYWLRQHLSFKEAENLREETLAEKQHAKQVLSVSTPINLHPGPTEPEREAQVR